MRRTKLVRIGILMAALVSSLAIFGETQAAPSSVSPTKQINSTWQGAAPELGVQFFADGNAGQCQGPSQQWRTSPDWTLPIRLDTDDRSGGCQLAFGVRDLDSQLQGLSLNFTWLPTPGADAGQCGNYQGTFPIPVTQFLAFSQLIQIDTDHRTGFCNLTFSLSGRNDVALDIQFWADGDADQCKNSLPQGLWWTVRTGQSITLGLDMDGRPGGCNLSLRLRQV